MKKFNFYIKISYAYEVIEPEGMKKNIHTDTEMSENDKNNTRAVLTRGSEGKLKKNL